MTAERMTPALKITYADRELTADALRAWAEHIGAGYSCPAASQTMLMAAAILDADYTRASPVPEPVAAMGPVAWRPIETAPKDGSWFIGFRPSRYAQDAVDSWSWKAFGIEENVFVDARDSVWEDFQPTHWMPLPPPPGSGIQPDQGLPLDLSLAGATNEYVVPRAGDEG